MSKKVFRILQAYPRKILKAAGLLVTVGYCSLLLYQGGVPFKFQESRTGTFQVADLSVKPVTTIDESAVKNITLDDIFISVKTGKRYEESRLPIILKTWFRLAKEQTWFFTDTDNPRHQLYTNGHMVNTKCADSHRLKPLCCKTSVEYDHFLDSGKKWFCHFDDDNYVNVPRLVTVLQRYNHQQDWFLGKPSLKMPQEMKFSDRSISFWFSTFGAGFCISRSLAFKMLPVASGGRFISVCEGTKLPDDVAMGFIIGHLMKNKLTVVPEFHSHYDRLKKLPAKTFRDQISFSYSKPKGKINVINVPGFNTKYDPTRFLSLHCFLFPHFKFCRR